MKTFLVNLPISFFAAFLFLTLTANAQEDLKKDKDKNKTTVEGIKEICPDLPYNKRVRVAVSSFNVSTVSNPGNFGNELAEMLTNGLQNTKCFNVLLSLKDVKEIQGEIEQGQSGLIDGSTTAPVGKMKGAQVTVIGKVTEFSSGEKKGGALGLSITGGNKAKIGFILQLVNTQTREIIDSKSFNVEGKTGGFSGGKILGIEIAGGTSNKSLQDACEKGIIQAVEYMASKKNQMELPDADNSASGGSKKFDASNCAILNAAYVPKIMVILPEYHIQRRIPDPAGETEINRMLTEAGFPVVDPAMFATLQNGTRFNEAAKDPMKAISLGREFGADVVIFGEAFSDRVGTQGNMISCRARVEIRAVKTDDATIVATNGLEGGGADLSESVAAKTALRNAASNVGSYMMEQICGKKLSYSKTAAKPAAGTGKINSVTEITVQNASELSKWKPLVELLNSKYKILEKNSSNGTAYIRVEHEGTIDELADFIDSKLGSKYSVKDIGDGKILMAVR